MRNKFPMALKLSHVPRWSIVDMIKDQTVSDHTFRTMVIVDEMIRRTGIDVDAGDVLLKVLYHDADEAITGDIPSTEKHHGIKDGTEDIDVIIKLCDTMEAYTYADRYAIKPKEVERFVSVQISVCIAYLSKRYPNIQSIFDTMVNEIGSYC